MSLTETSFVTCLEAAFAHAKDFHRDIRMSDRIVEDLDVDSLAAVEILVMLEDEYHVELIDDPKVLSIETVQELHVHVSSLVTGDQQ